MSRLTTYDAPSVTREELVLLLLLGEVVRLVLDLRLELLELTPELPCRQIDMVTGLRAVFLTTTHNVPKPPPVVWAGGVAWPESEYSP